MKIIVAGGTGLIGQELIHQLVLRNDEITLLVRNKNTSRYSNSSPHISVAEWDGKNQGEWTSHIDGADAVINLAGEPIAGKRWTNKQKKLIISSRNDSTNALVRAMKEAKKKPSVLINASAVGFYGNVEQGNVTETHTKGKGFLPDVCEQWEQEAKKAEQYGTRVVLLRTGIVLHKNGGALQKMLLPFQFFLGGPMGSGKQWFPWVHYKDEINIILFALDNKTVIGPINLSSSNPVTNKDFSAALGRAIHRPSLMAVPSIALQLILGEMADMLLGGQKVIPEKLLKAGYTFLYPDLKDALQDIFK